MHGHVAGTGSRRPAIAAAGVLTALVAGCATTTGTAPPPGPRQAIELAASTAGTVNSFTASISLRLVNSATGAHPTKLDGTVTEQVRPSLAARVDFAQFTVAGQSLPGGMSEIITAREIYLRLAPLGRLLHTGKPWTGLPLRALSASSGLNLNSLLGQLDTSSPLAQAQLLAGAKNVKTAGTGTVAGIPVTAYTGTYSLAGALSRIPASLRGSLSKAFRQAGVASGTVTFRVWIDGQHLVRKEISTLTAGPLTENLTTTVTSVNQPVTVTAPPASQVYTISTAKLGSAAG